ncbi:hypothetical protein NDU88_006751 [Pleurodeles waltl]|uniref:Uncharacterized protein n=1 Tax=Pleurodeles waltl TaxID=8319 RepID=A0AAV7N3B2_PLEWA|nr:hypothetical protein NDU88_006751 [Pleurodeles waltl]
MPTNLPPRGTSARTAGEPLAVCPAHVVVVGSGRLTLKMALMQRHKARGTVPGLGLPGVPHNYIGRFAHHQSPTGVRPPLDPGCSCYCAPVVSGPDSFASSATSSCLILIMGKDKPARPMTPQTRMDHYTTNQGQPGGEAADTLASPKGDLAIHASQNSNETKISEMRVDMALMHCLSTVEDDVATLKVKIS